MFNIDTAKHLAELSKIEFTASELVQITADMESIIRLMDNVSTFDASDTAYKPDAINYRDLRKDGHQSSSPTDEITKNAKQIQNGSFVVPKVV